MAQLKARDFDEHFLEQYPKLVNELDFILGDRALASDIAQDAFIRQYMAWLRLSRYDQPGAWVRKVAIRMAWREQKRRYIHVELSEASGLESADVDTARVTDVRSAIQKLTEVQRTAVVLHYYRDLPIAEVANILGCKESTAKSHLYLARKRLADLLIHYKTD